MTMARQHGQISYKSELARKSIHLLSLLIPIIYVHVPRLTGVTILVCMTLVSLGVDVARHYHAPSRAWLMKLIGPLLRKHETENGTMTLTGATWVLIAATLTLGVFPLVVGVAAFCVLIVSDTFAALVGRRYGVRRFLDKSLVGTSTFIITGWLVVLVVGQIYHLPSTFYVAGCIGACSAGLAEAAAVRFRIDDNLAIPLSMAMTMMILERLLQTLGGEAFSHLVR